MGILGNMFRAIGEALFEDTMQKAEEYQLAVATTLAQAHDAQTGSDKMTTILGVDPYVEGQVFDTPRWQDYAAEVFKGAPRTAVQSGFRSVGKDVKSVVVDQAQNIVQPLNQNIQNVVSSQQGYYDPIYQQGVTMAKGVRQDIDWLAVASTMQPISQVQPIGPNPYTNAPSTGTLLGDYAAENVINPIIQQTGLFDWATGGSNGAATAPPMGDTGGLGIPRGPDGGMQMPWSDPRIPRDLRQWALDDKYLKTYYRAPKGYVVVRDQSGRPYALKKEIARQMGWWKPAKKPPISVSDWQAFKKAERVAKKLKKIANSRFVKPTTRRSTKAIPVGHGQTLHHKGK